MHKEINILKFYELKERTLSDQVSFFILCLYKLTKSNSSFFQKRFHSIVRGFEARDGNRVKKIQRRVQIHAEKKK